MGRFLAFLFLAACTAQGSVGPVEGETRLARFERVTLALQNRASALVHDALGLDRSGIRAATWGGTARLRAACHLESYDASLGAAGTTSLIDRRERLLTAPLSGARFIDEYIEVQESLPPAVEAEALRRCGPIEPPTDG